MLKTKPKPCKGTHSDTKGLGCGKVTEHRVLGLGKMCGCYNDFLLNTEAGRLRMERATLRASKKVKKQKDREFREKKRDQIDYSKKLQTEVQKIARLIDIGQPCIVRRYHANQLHGGHVFSKGAWSSIRYDLHNIHRQSAQSNTSGNDDGALREAVKEEYGTEYWRFLSNRRSQAALKYTNREYEAFYRKACKIAKDLKRAGMVLSKKERIEMRNQVNKELGIYDHKQSIFKP